MDRNSIFLLPAGMKAPHPHFPGGPVFSHIPTKEGISALFSGVSIFPRTPIKEIEKD